MKRKLKWTTVVFALLLLGFGTALFLWPRDRISAESWKQIQIGMSEEEVEDILGGRGTSSCQCKGRHIVLFEPFGYGILVPLIEDTHKFWPSQPHCLQIGFDGTGKVGGKVLWESDKPSSFIDRLRDWLGW